jgi:hypothetical protein
MNYLINKVILSVTMLANYNCVMATQENSHDQKDHEKCLKERIIKNNQPINHYNIPYTHRLLYIPIIVADNFDNISDKKKIV